MPVDGGGGGMLLDDHTDASPQATVQLTLVRGEGLYCSKASGEVHPYVVARVTCAGVSSECRGENHKGSSSSTDFGNEVLELRCFGHRISDGDTLSLVVKDRHYMSDSTIGEATLNLASLVAGSSIAGLAREREIRIHRPQHCNGTIPAGKVFIKLGATWLLWGTATIATMGRMDTRRLVAVPGKMHRNAFAGFISQKLGEGDSMVSFHTYEVGIPHDEILAHFGDRYQANYDEKHAKLFADCATGKVARAAMAAEHHMFYRDGLRPGWMRPSGERTTAFLLSCGTDLLNLLHGGMRENKCRVFTYVLTDEGLFFSETGVVMSKDIFSKHAVHADGNERVRYAGTFRICFGRRLGVLGWRGPILVLDNDSGTYRPFGSDGWRLERLLQHVFPDLHVKVVSVTDPQRPWTYLWSGPVETGPEAVYAGKWIWSSMLPLPQPCLNCASSARCDCGCVDCGSAFRVETVDVDSPHRKTPH